MRFLKKLRYYLLLIYLMKVVEYYYKNSIFGVYIMKKGYMLQNTCSKFIVGRSYTKNL